MVITKPDLVTAFRKIMKKIFLILSLCFLTQAFGENLAPFSLPVYGEKGEFSYKPGKKTLINFWASWCTSCIQEIPELEALKKAHPEMEFLAVNAGDNKRKIKKFLSKTGFSYKVLMDKSKSFSKGLGVLNLPQTFVIDEKGKVIYHENVPPKKL